MKRLQESRIVEISSYGLMRGVEIKPPLLLYFNLCPKIRNPRPYGE